MLSLTDLPERLVGLEEVEVGLRHPHVRSRPSPLSELRGEQVALFVGRIVHSCPGRPRAGASEGRPLPQRGFKALPATCAIGAGECPHVLLFHFLDIFGLELEVPPMTAEVTTVAVHVFGREAVVLALEADA